MKNSTFGWAVCSKRFYGPSPGMTSAAAKLGFQGILAENTRPESEVRGALVSSAQGHSLPKLVLSLAQQTSAVLKNRLPS